MGRVEAGRKRRGPGRPGAPRLERPPRIGASSEGQQLCRGATFGRAAGARSRLVAGRGRGFVFVAVFFAVLVALFFAVFPGQFVFKLA